MSRRQEETAPTEANPDHGCVAICGEVEFEAYRWIDPDGAHVVQSTDFDIYGQGDTWEEAFWSFVETADDVFNHLIAQIEAGDALPAEKEAALELGPRLIAAHQAINKLLQERVEVLERRRVNLWPNKHRQVLPQLWHSEPPKISSHALPV
jgi:hypothetical protein